jgi:hypothetical protein
MQWGGPWAPGSTVRNRTTEAALKVKSGQLDWNRVGARPQALQFLHESLRNQRLFARVGPTTPKHRARVLRASVDPTEARNVTVRRIGRSDRCTPPERPSSPAGAAAGSHDPRKAYLRPRSVAAPGSARSAHRHPVCYGRTAATRKPMWS